MIQPESMDSYLKGFIQSYLKEYLKTQEGKQLLLEVINEGTVKTLKTDLEGLIKHFPFLKKSTIYKKCTYGTFPHSKNGKRLVFDIKEVEQHLSNTEDLESDVYTEIFLKNRNKKRYA